MFCSQLRRKFISHDESKLTKFFPSNFQCLKFGLLYNALQCHTFENLISIVLKCIAQKLFQFLIRFYFESWSYIAVKCIFFLPVITSMPMSVSIFINSIKSTTNPKGFTPWCVRYLKNTELFYSLSRAHMIKRNASKVAGMNI